MFILAYDYADFHYAARRFAASRHAADAFSHAITLPPLRHA